MPENPALKGVKDLIAKMADTLPTAYISCTKAMLAPRKRGGVKKFYFTTNTFSLRVAHYKADPKASIYFCDENGFEDFSKSWGCTRPLDDKCRQMVIKNINNGLLVSVSPLGCVSIIPEAAQGEPSPCPLGVQGDSRAAAHIAPKRCDVGLEPTTPRTTIWCSTN